MKLKTPDDFYQIRNLRERIGASEGDESFSEKLDPLEEIVIKLEEGEIQVERNEIVSHGPFLLFKGEILAILYIYDYRATQEDLLSESVDKKAPNFTFHGVELFKKWIRRANLPGIFFQGESKSIQVQATERDPVMIRKLGEHHEMEDVLLYACKNCLNETGYKGYSKDLTAEEKNEKVKSFKIDEFISENEATVSTSKFYLESQRVKFSDETVQPMIYSNDFPEISRKLRHEHSWTCSKCKVDMSNMRSGLHTHHRNGVKNDNSRNNLQVLCALCHQGIDEFHKNMHVSRKISDFIISNRP